MFGAKLAYVNHVTQQGQTPDMPETGGESGVAPEEFPHLVTRMTRMTRMTRRWRP